MKERGVRLLRSTGMSAEMKAAASEKKSATNGTMTLNRSHHGMTARPEVLVSEGTVATEEGKRPETLETTGT